MADATEEITVDRKLHEIFDEAFNLYNSFETCNDPTNGSEFQANIKKCMQTFEDATRLVSIIGLFSENESYEEVATNELKYLLLPFFLGQLSQKLCGKPRQNIVEVSETYFNDFLKRCKEYELCENSEEKRVATSSSTGSDEAAMLTRMVSQRNNKLEQYRKKKELQDQIKQLKMVMEREHADEDQKRDFYLQLLRLSVIDAQEELASIDQEKQILEFQKNMQADPDFAKRHERRPVQPLKPIIITKDLAQKAVFGLGYPSLPTMTVSEFYDQRVREGIFPDPSKAKENSLQSRAMGHDTAAIEEAQDIEKETKLEEDDEETVQRARAMDEYKDDHRRGEGNRHNRS